MENNEYRERLKLFEETSFEAITVYDENLRCIDTNSMTTAFFQYTREEILGMWGLDFFEPRFRETALRSVQHRNREPYEALMIRKDGTTFPAIIQGTSLEMNGRTVRVSTCRDITDLKQKDDEFQAIFETSTVGIFLMRDDRIIERANQAVARILGYDSPRELIGRDIGIIHPNEGSYKSFGEFYSGALLRGEMLQFDYQFKKRNGDLVWVNLSGNAVDRSLPADIKKGVVWCIDDISRRKTAEEELIRLSRTDSLTGILNRGFFLERAGWEFSVHRRYGRPLALMMLDIDHFKDVNDTFGHAVGDLALRFLTDLCGEIIRDTDLFGRLGGEEFGLLLQETDLDLAWAIAERIRGELQNRTRAHGQIPPMTISIGLIAVGEESLEEALKRADDRLYAAKKGGRNRICR